MGLSRCRVVAIVARAEYFATPMLARYIPESGLHGRIKEGVEGDGSPKAHDISCRFDQSDGCP